MVLRIGNCQGQLAVGDGQLRKRPFDLVRQLSETCPLIRRHRATRVPAAGTAKAAESPASAATGAGTAAVWRAGQGGPPRGAGGSGGEGAAGPENCPRVCCRPPRGCPLRARAPAGPEE